MRLDREAVHEEIISRLRKLRDRGDFRAVHVERQNAEIPDLQEARLVVLPPAAPHTPKGPSSRAEEAAMAILDRRGESPRRWRNMLVFVAADEGTVDDLQRETRQYLAWQSVIEDRDALNLDAHQEKQAKEALVRSGEVVNRKLNDAYAWLLVPTQEGTERISWQIGRLGSGNESPVLKAAKKVRREEFLIVKWSPALLRMELDRWLWKDVPHLSLKKLWEYLCTYCYLPRLGGVDVLKEAIREGVRSRDSFGYATSVSPMGRYQGLVFGADPGGIHIDDQSVIVKPEVARAQADGPERSRSEVSAVPGTLGTVPGGLDPEPAQRGAARSGQTALPLHAAARPIRFFGTASLDPTRFGRDMERLSQEVIQHLSSLVGARIELTLDIHAEIVDGFPDGTVRIVSENCRTLRLAQFGFEKE